MNKEIDIKEINELIEKESAFIDMLLSTKLIFPMYMLLQHQTLLCFYL